MEDISFITPQGTFKPENEEQANQFFDALQDAIVQEEDLIQKQYDVSSETASTICYLRGRSRWSEEKEQELVRRDKEGNPIKIEVVLRGDF